MPKTKTSRTPHTRLTRRARNLVTLMHHSRFRKLPHTVRQAIVAELRRELDRARRGARRGRSLLSGGRSGSRKTKDRRSFWSWARDTARHLNNRRRHGATFIGHDGREIPGGGQGHRAYMHRHAREADRSPQARDGRQDQRTARERLADNLADRLNAAGLPVPDGRPDRGTAGRARPSRPEPSPERAAEVRALGDWWGRTGPQVPARESRDTPDRQDRTETPEPYWQPARTDARLDPAGAPPLPADLARTARTGRTRT